jgi:hypothetical protein
MTFSAPKAEKITVTIPYELKEQLKINANNAIKSLYFIVK